MLNFYVMTADTIQSNKKIFVNLFVSNPELKQAWNDYVDDQTEFIHRALVTGNRVSLAVAHEMEKYFSLFNSNWEIETTQSNKQSQ